MTAARFGSQSLVHLDFSNGPAARSIGYHNSVLDILQYCVSLETLLFSPCVVDAQVIAARDVPWTSVKLRKLSLALEYKLGPEFTTDESKEQETTRVLHRVFAQFGLSRRESFTISGGHAATNQKVPHSKLVGTESAPHLRFQLE